VSERKENEKLTIETYETTNFERSFRIQPTRNSTPKAVKLIFTSEQFKIFHGILGSYLSEHGFLLPVSWTRAEEGR
jgi:hypothetical protein